MRIQWEETLGMGAPKNEVEKKSNSDVIIVKSTTIMQENCISHVQRTDNILMRSTKDLKNIPPPSPFWKIFWGILLIYVACPGLFHKWRVVYLQRSARRSGMPDPWNWSPSKCTTQHPRRSHFWCTKSQVWSGWKTIAEIQKGLRLNNALLIKTRTMQRTTGKFVSWFFPPIYWGQYLKNSFFH